MWRILADIPLGLAAGFTMDAVTREVRPLLRVLADLAAPLG